MATIGASRYVCILTAFLTVIASYRPTLAQVSLNRACSEQARYKSDVGPNTIRLIDADCSQETPPKIGTSFVDKNYRSQFMHGVIKLRLRNLWGQGITVGVWDAGHVLDRHVELAGRISFGDPKRTIDANIGPVPVPLHEHSTHVAGTIGASGTTQETAQGMAPKGQDRLFFLG